LADDGTQLFKSYPAANSDYFLDYLKRLHRKYCKMIFYMDRAPWHTEKRVLEYLKKNRKTIKVVWFPPGFPESNPLEECWNQGKDKIRSQFHDLFHIFKKAISEYYRTKRFRLNLSKYLCQ
jgi:transposase